MSSSYLTEKIIMFAGNNETGCNNINALFWFDRIKYKILDNNITKIYWEYIQILPNIRGIYYFFV